MVEFDTDTEIDGLGYDDLSDEAKLYLEHGAMFFKDDSIGGKSDEEVLEMALKYDGYDV